MTLSLDVAHEEPSNRGRAAPDAKPSEEVTARIRADLASGKERLGPLTS
jgi:hypothetical protein